MNLLYKLRTERDLSILEASEKLKVSNKSLSSWEAGRVIPSLKNTVILSEFYDSSLSELAESILKESNLHPCLKTTPLK